jgi:hypothetical protein
VTGRREFIGSLPGLAALAWLPAGSQGRVLGAWAGAVTPRGATLKVLASGPGLVLSLTLTDDASPPVRRSQTTDADGVATFELAGLGERTRYRYAVSVPGGPALEGRFRTFAEGPFSFRVLFASCAATGSTSPVFAAMRERDADLFVHMGDLHYEDIGRNAVSRFREAYLAVHASAVQSALFRSLPLAYTWDDHDFGPNDSDRTSPSRGAALEAYRRFVPHYPLADGSEAPVCQAFTVGRVRFLMTDVRSARSPRSRPRDAARGLGEHGALDHEAERVDARGLGALRPRATADRRPHRADGRDRAPRHAERRRPHAGDGRRVRLQGMRANLEVPGMRLEMTGGE